MRKLLSMMLVLALIFSMAPTVFAEETKPMVTATVDKTEVKAGETVTLSLSIDKPVVHLTNWEFIVYFDDTVYERTGGTVSESAKVPNVGVYPVVGFKIANISKDGRTGLRISGLSTQGQPFTLNAGDIASVTFTANETVTDATADLAVRLVYMNDYDTIKMVEGGVGLVDSDANLEKKFDIKVTEPDPEPEGKGYTVTMGEDKAVTVGENVNIPVTIGHTDETVTTYNAYDMTFTYDSAKLKLAMEAADTEGYKVIPGDGTVQVVRYGEEAALGNALTLSFTALAAGTSDVTVSSAKVDIAANAIGFDAPAAVLSDASTTVTVSGYTVTLPDDFTTDEEDMVVEPGENFTFKPVDPNYDYTFSATVGDTKTENLTFGENGTYTIENINGNVTVAVTGKTSKSFAVTRGDDITGAETATYNTDYSFTLTKASGYTYNVQVSIGGTAYTGFTSVENSDGTITYTIPGNAITGAIAINSNKAAVSTPTAHTVTFTGTGAGDIAEGTATTVADCANYTFTLNKAANYTYTVTATMGGTTATVNASESGYTIENVTGDLVINIEKVYDLGITVAVSNYVELDDQTMYLVTVTGTPEEGKAYAYDSNVMYKTTAYGENVYSWLVIVGKDEAALTVETATAKVTQAAATAEVLAQTYDVNMTGVVDVNDAQLVYDMYNGKYADFTTVSVQKFLNADVNISKTINSDDAVAVVNNFTTPTNTAEGEGETA